MRYFLILLCLVMNTAQGRTIASERVRVSAGKFSPLYGLENLQSSFEVPAFEVDVTPVTYEQFAEFLGRHPEWYKTKVFQLYVDSKYLGNWKTPKKYDARKDAPVVQVSWYAALAYCEDKHGRLPSTLEWEYIAAASETNADASKDESFKKKLLDWYSKPQGKPQFQKVGAEKPNFYGVKNLHGLIWEWTNDFNSFFIASDNRSADDKSKDLFCGAGSLGAKEKENYAAFLRYAFRGSLQARYSTDHLGFRCAYDVKEK